MVPVSTTLAWDWWSQVAIAPDVQACFQREAGHQRSCELLCRWVMRSVQLHVRCCNLPHVLHHIMQLRVHECVIRGVAYQAMLKTYLQRHRGTVFVGTARDLLL